MTEQDLLIEMAIYLYDQGKLTHGQARQLAQLDLVSFQKAMDERGIGIKYGLEEWEEDLETIAYLDRIRPADDHR